MVFATLKYFFKCKDIANYTIMVKIIMTNQPDRKCYAVSMNVNHEDQSEIRNKYL